MRIIYASIYENGKKVRKAIALEDRKCEYCGIVFSPFRQESKYCSKKCSKKAEQVKHRDRYRENSRQWYKENIESAQKRRKEYYWERPELFKQKAKEYREANKEKVRTNNDSYKDKIRHGDLRKKLIEIYGTICQMCKKECEGFDLTAHHISGDPTDHNNQTLLCRSCHAKVHDLGSKKRKDISREQIEYALTKFRTLDEMCKYLEITRSFLRKKRIEYGFPDRTFLRGVKK